MLLMRQPLPISHDVKMLCHMTQAFYKPFCLNRQMCLMGLRAKRCHCLLYGIL